MRCFTAQHTKIGLILFFGRAVGHHHVVRHEIHLYVSDLKPTMIFWLFQPTYFLEIYGAALYICTHRNCRSYARRSILEKRGEFFQLICTLFCVVKRGFVDPCKSFLRSKLPWSRVEISRLFTRVFFAQNVCRTCQTYEF
jgi:hypothetical protein